MTVQDALLLSAGFGTRLAPLTYQWPKCLMPVQGRPLLDYWLSPLAMLGFERVFVNVHAHMSIVLEYLARPCFRDWVIPMVENELLGTAGTVKSLVTPGRTGDLLVAHGDNLCECDLAAFLAAHGARPIGCDLTMMTFTAHVPSSCGIVEVDENSVVQSMVEKPAYPNHARASAAVYVLSSSALHFIREQPRLSDMSLDVLPSFMGKVLSWHNEGVMRDIGSLEQLMEAQKDVVTIPNWPQDEWQERFMESEIFRLLERTTHP